MKVLGIKLQKVGLIMMSIAGIIVGMSGCEDRLDTPRPPMPEGKSVDVSLCVGIADEENNLVFDGNSANTKTMLGLGLDVQQVLPTETKTITEDPLATAKPDKLYGLEIWQYDTANGALKGGKSIGDVEIGTSFNVTLDATDTESQLLIIARGYHDSNYTVGSLSGKGLSAAQEIVVSSSIINKITNEAYQTDKSAINAMPYILFLPKVKVKQDGGTYKIQSSEGADIRILLRRLACRLTIVWKNVLANTKYNLKQVLLQSIPTEYQLIPSVGNVAYPSLMDQYTTISIPDIKEEGSYTCWLPTVVRGDSPNAISAYYRTKENAPNGSVYVSLISQNPADSKKKLNYRVYLGGTSSQNFDLKENTNYIYKITMSHSTLPVNDHRVTIIDPIPASENNNNVLPTANCFMIQPGVAFCFDPFKFEVNGDRDNLNETLKSWSDKKGGIAYVRVIWQTKENGDVGDPVLGVVTSDTDHTNIVDIKKNDGSSVSKGSTLTTINQGCIYCRVAPNTSGGNGLIAAYDSNDDILWSWHIWVTDYSPDATINQSIYEPANKRKQKYTYRCQDQYPMMDRNLGANIGYTEIPESEEERSKANGLHYQWGRKDPFPSSYSVVAVTDIEVSVNGPTKGMLNLYQPDGFSFYQRNYDSRSNPPYSVVYQTPTIYYGNWNSYADARWQTTSGIKNEHDPCPVGWRVASYKNFESFFTEDGYDQSTSQTANVPVNMKNSSSVLADGGALLYYEDKGAGHTTYFRFNGYQRYSDRFMYVGVMTNIWCREIDGSRTSQAYAFSINYGGYPFNGAGTGTANNIRATWNQTDAHSVRCIQERAN